MTAVQAERQKTIYDIIGKKMDGCELVFGYQLELDHGLMGNFPALSVTGPQKEQKRVVYTDDVSVLRDLWKLLPRQAAKINKFLFVKTKEGDCFPITFDICRKIEKQAHLPLMNREEFERLRTMEGHSFRWASGLFSCQSDYSEEYQARVIDEAIEAAIKEPEDEQM